MKKEQSLVDGIIEMQCPVCKKNFIKAPMHIYRYGGEKYGKFVCSYSCMLKSIRENDKK